MTDARLAGYWLGEVRFADLTDRQWRVFTGALMWSAEQGTDGVIPARYLRMLHPEGIEDADIDALVECGLFVRTDLGIEMPGWADEKGLRQSTAAAVERYRSRKRENQAAYRERRRTDSATGNVTGHVAGQVGVGKISPLERSSAYVAGQVTGHGKPRRTRAHNCAVDGHQLIADGTCTKCEYRDRDAAGKTA